MMFDSEITRKKLCVVLLNYRTPTLVIDCLESLIPELSLDLASVVVVDNNSQDDSQTIISNWISEKKLQQIVEIISSDHNGGFAAGNNLGIRHLKAEYYLLLNSDTLVRKNAIHTMLSAMDGDSRIGLLGPRLEWPDSTPQESCFRFHTPVSELLSSSGTGVFLRIFSNYEVACRTSDVAENYGWVSFACVMIRSTVFADTGYLDEGFFMYFEDVEFCYRAKKAGWVIRNHPSARVVHLRGGSSPVKENIRQRKRQVRYFYESRTRYFFRLYGRIGLLSANLLWLLGWLFACSRSLVQKRFKPPVCESEWRDIWTNFFCPEKAYIHPKDYK